LLKSRVVELVDLAAHRAGLQRMTRRGKVVGMATSTPVVEASTATDAASPHLPG
jgi:hypothetical protein